MTSGFFALYGASAYALFFGTILYAIGFVGNLPLPKTIDSGPSGDVFVSVVINVALLSLFAVQHSVMARQGFKAMWTRIVPKPIERSTYVALSSLALILLFWQWRPLPAVVWDMGTPLAEAMTVMFWIGWGLVFLSTFLINHFELFGLRQVYARLRGREIPAPEFRTPMLYKHVRHPLYLGFVIAFWCTPLMSVGHLMFAAVTTGYILVAIVLEERDLVNLFGEQYRRYKTQVPMLFPSLFRGTNRQNVSSGEGRTSA